VLDAFDAGERRDLGGQPGEEGVHRRVVAFDLEQDPALVVEDEAAELELAREAVYVGPEAHALHRALHARADPARAHGRASTSSRSA
jgi:hypothetical protein